MSEENKIEAITATVQNRRAFVKTAAKVAVTAPAAAMLLNASVKSAKAEPLYDTGNPGDDRTIISDDAGQDDFYGFNNGDFVP